MNWNVNNVVRAPLEVIGYHGCHVDVAAQAVAGASLKLSSNRHDWLGSGIYFWEYGPDRAMQWAEEKHPGKAAVLQARIRLGNCLNLLDTEYHGYLNRIYASVVETYRESSKPLPSNQDNKQNFLDCAILNKFCDAWEQVSGKPFQSVRGCFAEGDPIYSGSKLLSHSHVQIAIRDATCIKGIARI